MVARRSGHRDRHGRQGPEVVSSHALKVVPVSTTARYGRDWAQRASGRVDVVTCMEMLEHVPDPA